ncbi:Cullin-2 [Lobulomyces angularis]|nr:Cullin-2 [Lobulomyces angularis]
MSLRGKSVDFKVVFASFKVDLESVYNYSKSKSKTTSSISLFQLVFDCCNATPKPFINELTEAISNFLTDQCTICYNEILLNTHVVTSYAFQWERYEKATVFLSKVCEYLDRMRLHKANMKSKSRSGRKAKIESIQGIAYAIWTKRVIKRIKLENNNILVVQLIESIKNERNFDFSKDISVDMIIKQSITSFVEVNLLTDNPYKLYIEEFENFYIEDLKEYYRNETSRNILSLDISSYMKKAAKRLTEEALISKKYLDPSSFERAVKECECQYISVHANVINSELESMIEYEKLDDCQLAFDLFSRIPNGLDEYLKIFENFVIKKGKLILEKISPAILRDPTDIIESLIKLQANFQEVFCYKTFKKNLKFISSLDKAIGILINETEHEIKVSEEKCVTLNLSEILARYCDLLLKKNNKMLKSVEVDVEEKMASAYISDKDVFQKFYSRLLARRLIFKTSESEELELNMIYRLKVACGYEYTSKLQRMFTDISTSADLNTKFQATHAVDDGFSVCVLTSGSWPISGNVINFQLPIELEKSIEKFTKFYLRQHSGRKLTWLHQFSKGDIRLLDFDKKYEINLSLFQMCVLTLFNSNSKLSVKEISDSTSLGTEEIKKILKTFTEIKLILIEGDKEIKSDSICYINTKFKSKKIKVKISSATQGENQQENDSTRRAIDEDRNLLLQASIVRIMKNCKTTSHINLLQLVIEQVKSKFKPEIFAIKKSIESLIEKQFLERKGDGYIYIS